MGEIQPTIYQVVHDKLVGSESNLLDSLRWQPVSVIAP